MGKKKRWSGWGKHDLHYLLAKPVRGDSKKIVDSELGEGMQEGKACVLLRAENVLQSESSLDITCA